MLRFFSKRTVSIWVTVPPYVCGKEVLPFRKCFIKSTYIYIDLTKFSSKVVRVKILTFHIPTQCEDWRIFLLVRFYVKSISVNWHLKMADFTWNQFQWIDIWKWQILLLKISQNWIHVILRCRKSFIEIRCFETLILIKSKSLIHKIDQNCNLKELEFH